MWPPAAFRGVFLRPLLLLLLAVLPVIVVGRRHHLEIHDDYRGYIALSTFGFLKGGQLDVRLSRFRVPPGHESGVFGLSLDKTQTEMVNQYLDLQQDRCILNHPATGYVQGPIVLFAMDLSARSVSVSCSRDWPRAFVYTSSKHLADERERQSPISSYMPTLERMPSLFPAPLHRRRRRDTTGSPSTASCAQKPLELLTHQLPDGTVEYSMQFTVWVPTVDDEGLYNLYFHACPNYKSTPVPVNFQVDIEETNRGSFLSAGEMPLPALYFMLSILFCLSGLFWVFILCKSKHPVFKIHYIMAVLVFLKALSLLFHAINFHFIEVLGEHVETWAILFYVAHLLKGALLFITIVLIGTGYTFIKHILSDQDKRLFVVVIPLQIVANVAQIIIAEGEEADKDYRTWTNVLYMVDLMCCAAIMFPVVWSIRHLQEAAQTDGKVATNLRKLRLFRQFYIMIVFYIYLTRIVAYLLRMTVPFQYGWLDEMFREMATYVFFVLTAYKFRPTGTHPYFAVPDDDECDDDDEADDEPMPSRAEQEAIDAEKNDNRQQRAKKTIALTRSGLIEGSGAGLARKTQSGAYAFFQRAPASDIPAQAQSLEQRLTVIDALDEFGCIDERDFERRATDDFDSDASQAMLVDDRLRLLAKRESSHEYD